MCYMQLDSHARRQGAAGGIGIAAVELFLKEGARGVAMLDHSMEALRLAQGALFGSAEDRDDIASRTFLVAADVTTEAGMLAAFISIQARFAVLDVAVINAGLSQAPCSLLLSSVDVWERLQAVNVRGSE